MGDYIERQALLDAYDEVQRKNGPWRFETLIESVPAADVRPVVRGRWKYFHKKNKAVCTVCSFERDLDQNFGKAIACPNCGAEMNQG